MPLFRRTLDIQSAAVRPAAPADLTAISRLVRDSAHRFLNSSGDLPALLGSAPGVVLAGRERDEIWGLALAGWPLDGVAWVRGLAVADGLPLGGALDRLLPAFHEHLRSRELHTLFYAGDLSADTWALPALQERGYIRATDVIVYEKRALTAPGSGNQDVRVRRAQSVDIARVLEIDRACFEAQWVKDEGILGPAITGEVPFFVVAEHDGALVGYSFATAHFQGRLVHLVRIAVDPAWQGRAVGVRLMAEVVAFARSQGADSLTLNTQLENRTAQRLYEWFGFRRTGERQLILKYPL